VGTDSYGWGATRTIVALLAGAALLVAFAVIEGRLAAAPLVPLRIFGSRQLTGANVVVFLLGSAVFAMWYFVTLYLQEVLGYTPIEAGLAFLPMTVMIVFGSIFASRLVSSLGAGRLLVLGLTLVAAGMLLFARVAVAGSYGGDVVLPSLLTASGLGLAFVPVTIAAVAGVAPHEAGLASGLVNTSRQVGGSLGLAVLATLATQRTSELLARSGAHAALTSGFHRAFLVGAVFAAVGAVAGLMLPGQVRVRPAPAEV
jgi:predicted MFS family arabinose efflux permease